MRTFTSQVAAWRDSWRRLSDDDSGRRKFLARVGRKLGEDDESTAIRRASTLLGVTPPRGRS